MTANLDWRRAKAKPAAPPTRKEQRLDKAADNWLERQSLSGAPKPVAKKPAKRKVTR